MQLSKILLSAKSRKGTNYPIGNFTTVYPLGKKIKQNCAGFWAINPIDNLLSLLREIFYMRKRLVNVPSMRETNNSITTIMHLTIYYKD